MTKDHFAPKAGSYDQSKDRVDNVAQIANAILGNLYLTQSMHIMDFGSGTGLLLERLAPYVGKVTAVDVSPSMNAQLRQKLSTIPCEVEILDIDLEKSRLDRKFDGIISSMTMHHIHDVPTMFGHFHAMLNDGGFIAIADLESEDGTFHSQDTGVHHHGFSTAAIVGSASTAGFKNVAALTVSIVRKEQGDYPVFLLTATR